EDGALAARALGLEDLLDLDLLRLRKTLLVRRVDRHEERALGPEPRHGRAEAELVVLGREVVLAVEALVVPDDGEDRELVRRRAPAPRRLDAPAKLELRVLLDEVAEEDERVGFRALRIGARALVDGRSSLRVAERDDRERAALGRRDLALGVRE